MGGLWSTGGGVSKYLRLPAESGISTGAALLWPRTAEGSGRRGEGGQGRAAAAHAKGRPVWREADQGGGKEGYSVAAQTPPALMAPWGRGGVGGGWPAWSEGTTQVPRCGLRRMYTPPHFPHENQD